jgi:DNA repair protein RadA/Sms
VLLAGEPGTGKSTLMLGLARPDWWMLYVPRIPGLIRLRAGAWLPAGSVPGHRVERGTALRRLKPVVLIVDSIQTVYSQDIGTVPGQ